MYCLGRDRSETIIFKGDHVRQPCNSGADHTFSQEMLQHRICQQPLQPGVLILEPLLALRLADIHADILGHLLVDGRIADAMLTAQIGDGNPGLMLFQNANDLVFGEPAALHLWSFRLGQSLPQTGLAGGRNVTGDGNNKECGAHAQRRQDGLALTGQSVWP